MFGLAPNFQLQPLVLTFKFSKHYTVPYHRHFVSDENFKKIEVFM